MGELKAWMVSGRSKVWCAGNLLMLFVLLMVNEFVLGGSYFGYLSFSSPRLNGLVLITAYLLPTFACALLWLARNSTLSQPSLHTKGSLVGAILLIPISLIGWIVAATVLFCSFDSIKSDKPSGFFLSGPPVLINRINLGDMQVLVARNGDLDSDCLCFEQERQVFSSMPGIVWIRHLYTKQDARDVVITIIDRHHLRCVFPPATHRERTDTVIVENP